MEDNIIKEAEQIAEAILAENRRPRYVKDIIGKRVVLSRNVTTRGGGTFFKGQEMWVSEAHKGTNYLVLKPTQDMLILELEGETCVDWSSITAMDGVV